MSFACQQGLASTSFASNAVPVETEYTSDESTIGDEALLPTAGKHKSSRQRTKHRIQGYNRRWKAKFPWIRFSDSNTGMFCSVCCEANTDVRSKSGVWVSNGCKSYRLDKIRQHERSQAHKEACAVKASRSSNIILNAFRQQHIANKAAILSCMKCLYFLVKREIPHTTNYGELLKLIEHLGVKELQCLRSARNATYTSQRIIADFLQVLSSTVEEDIVAKMKSSNTIALMADESTTVSVTKELVIYGRCIFDGKLSSPFLKIADGKADTIVTALLSYLETVEIPISQLSSFGSDGAAVMIGSRSGVATQLKTLNPTIINVHCICHRLALASSQAAAEVRYLKKVKEVTLFHFYSNSAVRTAGLEHMQQLLGDPHIKVKEAKDVRWLSHQKAVATVVQIYPSLIASLQSEANERGNPTALGLFTLMTKFQFLCAITTLNDLLPHLSKLSLIFQKKLVDLSVISCFVNATIAVVQQRLPSHEKIYTDAEDISARVRDVANVDINIPNGAKESFDSQVRRPFLVAVIDHLRSRFPTVEVLEAFSMFDPHNLPADSINEVGAYGDDKLDILLKHYEGTELELDREQAVQEWEMLRTIVVSNHHLQTARCCIIFVQPTNRRNTHTAKIFGQQSTSPPSVYRRS